MESGGCCVGVVKEATRVSEVTLVSDMILGDVVYASLRPDPFSREVEEEFPGDDVLLTAPWLSLYEVEAA